MGDTAHSRPYWLIAAGLVLLAAALAAIVIVVRGVPILNSRESYSGYLAAVWDPDGRHVYVLQRDTVGRVTGLGWEMFTPPARVRVRSDVFTLLRIDTETGKQEVLRTIEESPVVGRAMEQYRGRIFSAVSARLEPTSSGVRFVVQMSIPRVPQSEPWELIGEWPGAPGGWEPGRTGTTATSDAVLMNGIEVLTVPGDESFPAAVLLVDGDGAARVLLENDRFAALYPAGVPPGIVAERSHRARIERSREIDAVRTELIEQFRGEGLNEGEASLRAHDEMAKMGYFARSAQLVALEVDEPPAELRVFDIPDEYLRVGLFQDIAQAIERPGEEVPASTGTYLRYYDDDLGPQLRAWIESGQDRFVVSTGGTQYLLEIRRFD